MCRNQTEVFTMCSNNRVSQECENFFIPRNIVKTTYEKNCEEYSSILKYFCEETIFSHKKSLWRVIKVPLGEGTWMSHSFEDPPTHSPCGYRGGSQKSNGA